MTPLPNYSLFIFLDALVHLRIEYDLNCGNPLVSYVVMLGDLKTDFFLRTEPCSSLRNRSDLYKAPA